MKGEYEKWIERLEAALKESRRSPKAVFVGAQGPVLAFGRPEKHNESKQDVSRCRKTCPARNGGACDC